MSLWEGLLRKQVKDMGKKDKVYPHIYPNLEDWPIYKLHQNRDQFVDEINAATIEKVIEKFGKRKGNLIAKTIYQERIRVNEEPWKVDPPNEKVWWRKLSSRFAKSTEREYEQQKEEIENEVLSQIVSRYSEEIVGTFKVKTFLFARKFLTMLFNRLLNTAASRNYKRIWSTRHRLYERLKVKGEIELVRSLQKKGTVILLPTHLSNLDSIIIGYMIDGITGLPAFSYGAGLNLYNTGYSAYYMNRLGAYRVDRRKKNLIYLETLKAMSNLSIQKGTNTIFFPGGTRSRSGSLETRLKLGLLSTSVEAQRAIYEKGGTDKVFIVPLVMSYNFVLEAKYLIEQHLRKVGEERYLRSKDQGSSIRKSIKFIWQMFSQSSEMIFSFGKPFDVLGNFVDENGVSFDANGKEVILPEYFSLNGEVTADRQRESVYTRNLSKFVVDRYHKENYVLGSHVVAYTMFKMLRLENPDLDLFALLRLPPEDYGFTKESAIEMLTSVQAALVKMENDGELKLADEVKTDVETLLDSGVKKLGVFHNKMPLKWDKSKTMIYSEDFNVLYFYHNRLDTYSLESKVTWPSHVNQAILVE